MVFKFISQHIDLKTITISEIFHKKIIAQNEFKLKEFNFRMLHNVLSCNANLKRWSKKDYDKKNSYRDIYFEYTLRNVFPQIKLHFAIPLGNWEPLHSNPYIRIIKWANIFG